MPQLSSRFSVRRQALAIALSLGTLLTAACGQTSQPSPNLAALTGVTAQSQPREIPDALRQQVKDAEKLLGKQAAFKSPAELEAYLTSVVTGQAVSAFDPEGMLASLGRANVRLAGREDRPTLAAVAKMDGYRPGTMVGGHEVLPQVWAFKIAMSKPEFFLKAIVSSNKAMEAPSRARGLYKKPFQVKQTAKPTGATPKQRYADAFAKLPELDSKFSEDVHSGIPPLNDPDAFSYGTYGIMRSMGFSDAEARRVGTMCVEIDHNKTPYGLSNPSPIGQMDRHFNLARGGQDTRLLWAKRHFEQAVVFARATAYDQAEIELGCGLHSLQDLFAHGQLTPSMHGIIGEFPDAVIYNPVGFHEAAGTTVAYLRKYLREIK